MSAAPGFAGTTPRRTPFFDTLKNDMYYRHTWPTRARAGFAVAEYIEVFFNRKAAALRPRLLHHTVVVDNPPATERLQPPHFSAQPSSRQRQLRLDSHRSGRS